MFDFPREQLALLLARKPQKHANRVKTTEQKIVVSISSLCYLIPAYSYSYRGDTLGALLFVVVTLFSGLADGSWFEEMPLLKLIDKWTATSGGMYAIIPKIWPFALLKITIQLIIMSLCSVTWLVLARRTGKSATWEWVLWQSVWHFMSACAVAKASFCDADGSGCFY